MKTQAKSRIYAALEASKKGNAYRVEHRKVFGRNICRLRVEADLTQEELCEAADIDRSYLQRIEKGSSNPTVEVAIRLKKALKCSWDALFKSL